jgi:hypothetical protein
MFAASYSLNFLRYSLASLKAARSAFLLAFSSFAAFMRSSSLNVSFSLCWGASLSFYWDFSYSDLWSE